MHVKPIHCLDIRFFLFGYLGTIYVAFLYTMCKRQQRREALHKQYLERLERIDPELGKQDQ
jgi:preprotein translocase subunit YajC